MSSVNKDKAETGFTRKFNIKFYFRLRKTKQDGWFNIRANIFPL